MNDVTEKLKLAGVQLLHYKVGLVSLVVLIILGITILEAQKISSNMTDQQLIDEKRLEIQALKVEFDEKTISTIKQRATSTDNQITPVDESTNNPFKYD